MGGEYRECVRCGRRFFATDASEYCSSSCFSTSQVPPVERGSRLWVVAALAFVIAVVVVLFESLDANVFFLVHVPPLRGWAASVVDSAGAPGLVKLHDALAETEDPEVATALVEALASCRELPRYQWLERLLKAVDGWYPAEGEDAAQRIFLAFFTRAGRLPPGRSFLAELASSRLRDETLDMFQAVRDPRTVAALRSVLGTPTSTPDLYGRAVVIARAMVDPDARNVELVAWILDRAPTEEVLKEAISALPVMIWPSEAIRFSGVGRPRVVAALDVLKAVAKEHRDPAICEFAMRAIEQAHKRESSLIQFDGLDFFESLLGK